MEEKEEKEKEDSYTFLDLTVSSNKNRTKQKGINGEERKGRLMGKVGDDIQNREACHKIPAKTSNSHSCTHRK